MNRNAKISALLAVVLTYLIFLAAMLAAGVWIVATVWRWANA